MNTIRLAGCCLLFAAAVCQGADLGVVTIADRGARVLRGATWYNLTEGARVQDGDVIEAADRGQVQVELNSGPVMNFAGPAGLLAVSGGAAAREGRPASTAEVYLPRGWLKFAAKKGGAPLRVRSASGAAGATDGVAVVHAETDIMEMFVETGAAKLFEPGKSGGDGVAHDLKSGDFALRAGERPFATADVPPQKFIAGLPRHFRVPLPALAGQFAVTRVQLAADRPISFAEAEPWLASPYRRLFIKRLQTRLSDPEFRSAAAAKAQAYPEWQAMLGPTEAPKAEPVKAEPAKPEPPKSEPETPKSIFHWPWEKKN
ncbi:MAG TPA: hypothetical protein VL742_04935 [Casimicrobiaceae bacterium]|nr:hypothetical protein [Casimicrobiaceae bacterium]